MGLMGGLLPTGTLSMELSQRFSRLKPSPTLALDARAKELGRQGTKVYNFSVGEPDFATPELVVETAIEGLRAGHTKYGQSGGGVLLRQAIAAKLKRDNNLTFEPDQIVCGMGAKEILFHLALALLNEGDEVIVPAPYWVSYTTHIEAAGAKAVIVPMPKDLSQPGLTPDILAPFITSRTKAILLNSPNNPAGYVMDRTSIEKLGKFLADQKIWIISDEIYEYLAFDAPHVSMLQICPDLKDRFILVNGMSKGFAMTGFRVGYCAAPIPLAKLVRSLQSHSSTCLPGFIEDAAIAALNRGSALMADDVQLLKNRRDEAIRLLRNISGLKFVPPQGAFYIYMDVRDCLKDGRFAPDETMAFSEFLLEKHHVAMVPGDAFGTKGFLRMSYAVNNNDLRVGIERLAQALKECSEA